jgi:hypothetical protein
MTYQDYFALNQINCPLRSGYIFGQRSYWILYRDYLVTFGLQRCDLVSPARAIGPYTMDKNNCWFLAIGGFCPGTGCYH